jgi:hypothetical protein
VRRMSEADIDRLLHMALQESGNGDTHFGRVLHQRLKACLTESEWEGDERWWLTDYAKKILAEMHGELGLCDKSGTEHANDVLSAVHLKRGQGGKRHLSVQLERIMLCELVVKELTESQDAGTLISIAKACRNVAGVDDNGRPTGKAKTTKAAGTVRNIWDDNPQYRVYKSHD